MTVHMNSALSVSAAQRQRHFFLNFSCSVNSAARSGQRSYLSYLFHPWNLKKKVAESFFGARLW